MVVAARGRALGVLKGVDLAENIVALAAQLRQRVSDRRALYGRVRMGVSETVALTWLGALVSRLNDEYPGIQLELDVDLSMSLWKKLAQGTLEIILLPGPVYRPDVLTQPVGRLGFVWMTSPKLGIPDQVMTPKTLERWPVVTLSPESNLHFVIEEWFRTESCKARRVDLCNSLSPVASTDHGGRRVQRAAAPALPAGHRGRPTAGARDGAPDHAGSVLRRVARPSDPAVAPAHCPAGGRGEHVREGGVALRV